MSNLNQPPQRDRPRQPPPHWRRPPGVAPGTWSYARQRAIADRYDAFVADTPLCATDASLIEEIFPERGAGGGAPPVVLDLGAGTGRVAIPLARRGYRVVAIDLSQPMLEVLREKTDAAFAQPPPVLAVRANLVQLEAFRDGVADHAICLFSTLGMIQGNRHRLAALGHVHRLVRPGGRFVLHVHHRWAGLREPGGVGRLSRSWFRSLVDREWEFGDATYRYRGLENMFMHRFTLPELKRLLADSGWELERCQGVSLDGSSWCRGRRPLRLDCGGFLVVARR